MRRRTLRGHISDLGKRDWWAEVKLRSGQTAWIDLNDSFDFEIK